MKRIILILAGVCLVTLTEQQDKSAARNIIEIIETECPVLIQSEIGICIEGCVNDTQCAENEKCCPNGCSSQCRKSCQIPNCNFCKHGFDYSILPKSRCRECHCKPDPCQSFRCPFGYTCRLRVLRCTKAPCKSITECVRTPEREQQQTAGEIL